MLRLVPGEGGGVQVETLWTEPVLRSTYVVPVYHDGFLYGMSGRVTLTCVDAARSSSGPTASCSCTGATPRTWASGET